MAKARQQYFADEVTLQKENRDFAIQPELIEKLESIEAGAQVNVIETVKVNGEALTPDENKAVDVSVPLVEDTLYSTDPDKALSANQGKVLYEYIQNLASRGRYLSNWNAVTGLPTTNPVDNPYQYRPGDYYVVSNVAAEGGTNYRPNGSSYSRNVASTTVETETVKVGDYYTYDGQHWLLLVNTSREIAIDSSLSTTSTNPVENRVITNALNTKQNNIADLETIRSGAALGATALQPGDSLSELTGTSDNITQGTTNLFMTTAERSKLSNQSGVNTGDETQTTIKNKLGQASTSTDGYLTSTDWNTFNNKQGAISDLETIRSNASAGKNASDTIATYGDIVTHDANEFATASQGGKADTALQPGDNVSELTNDAGYVTDAYHDSTKQDKLIAGANIQIAADGKTISATDTTYVAGDFDIKDLADSTGLRTEWSGKQDELIAGTNIQIAADGKTISATDTTYTAGPGISISNNNVISNTQTSAEWGNITGTLSDQTDLQSALDDKQDTLTAGANIQIAQDGTISATDTTYTAGTGIDITNGVISNTQTSAEWGNITGTLSNQTDLQSALNAKQDDMVILKYGISTWNDFITAYNKNGVVYCRASSQSNPATGSQTRLAFMAYVNNADNPTEVEFQYYRSRNDHNSAANQLDEVYVYKLTSNGTWAVTQRNTAAKATAGTGINLTYGSGNMTIANTGVTSVNSQTGDVTLTIPTVPTNVSDFVNDAGYITANDLPDVDTSMSDSSTNAVQNNVIKNYVDTQVQEATTGAVSDTAYGDSWNGITGIAPSKNAVYDKISAMDTTIAGKQNTISDLATIRTGAGKGATAVQPGDNVSTLTNDAGFITKAVNDLTNYYTKSETYTKSEVADYVANFAGFKVVATLPTTDIKTTIIYLLGPVGTGADKYEEYIYSNNAWVKIGETSVDLTNYFNTSTDNSDSITQGSTNLFLTSAERTKLSNTSGTNTGDETKATIQSKLGAATSSNDGYLSSADWTTFNNKQDALSTNNAGENIKISNGVISANNVFIITEDDVTVSTDDTKGVAPYNTSYGYTNIDISANAGIEWREGAIYTFVVDTEMVVASAYRNVRVRIGTGDYIPVMGTTAALGGNSYFIKTAIRQFQYTTKYEAGGALHVFTDSNTTYKAMTEAQATAGTSTTGLLVSPAVLKGAIQTHAVNDTAYASSWNGVTTQAPSKNAVYDKISAMDTTISGKQDILTAGSNITIGCGVIVESDMKGPCPSGFHVPTKTEFENLISYGTTLSLWTSSSNILNVETYLKLPFDGYRAGGNATATNTSGQYGYYWTVTPAIYAGVSYYLDADDRSKTMGFGSGKDRRCGMPIRAFKNTPVIPDNTWTTLYDGSSVATGAGIFHNSTLGLISVSGDGTNWITIQDKNLGATTVYNSGDTHTANNCGYFYQWGNNYGFARRGTITTSSTKVDASTYGPGNYYEGSSFITASSDWSSVENDNLWGGVTEGTRESPDCSQTVISATDTTYESKAAASGGTALSLVTTGEKYTWNNKANTSDINTKTFTITGTTDYTNATSAVQWYLDGKTPIIAYKDAELYDAIPEYFYLRDASIVSEASLDRYGLLFVSPTDKYNYPGQYRQLVIGATVRGGSIRDITSIAVTTENYYTAGTGISISNGVISSTVDGGNTKTFYLASTSDTTTAQAALDWYLAGNNPIISYNNRNYLLDNKRSDAMIYKSFSMGAANSGNSTSYEFMNYLGIALSSDTVTSISVLTINLSGYYLRTDTDYSTPYTPLYDGSPATKKYVDDNSTYNAGTGISIGSVTKNGRQGPSPDGFHVPSTTEWQGLKTIMDGLSLTNGNGWRINLHMPFAGDRDGSDASLYNQESIGYYWSSSPYGSNFPYYARGLYLESYDVSANYADSRTYGFPVRCFKDSYVAPDSSWVVVQGTLGSAGIFWDQSEGLISITNGTTGYTIMDKNLGATTVYSDGDTLSQANMGNMYQWGNNYGFQSTGTISNTSSTQVDASAYGPDNYYSSDTFIIGSNDWSSVQNDDLWGDTTGTSTLENVITNTGVLSVNGQTGDVTLSGGDMSYSDFGWQTKTGATITLDLASTYEPSANFTVNAPSTIRDGQTYILRVNNGATAYTMTLGTNVTNPYGTSIELTANGIDQFVFLAIDGELELQPEGGGGGGSIDFAPNSPLKPKYRWYGTQEQYEALSQYYTDEENDTVYYTI